MDNLMEKKLDGLYYRTPAKPYLCGPYRTVSTYNNCSFDQARKTQANSRTDYVKTAKDFSISTLSIAYLEIGFKGDSSVQNLFLSPEP